MEVKNTIFVVTVLGLQAIVLMLSITTTALGYHSHFNSAWRNGNGTYKPREMCENVQGYQPYTGCPSLALEIYFLVVLVLTLVASLSNFCNCCSLVCIEGEGERKGTQIFCANLLWGILILIGGACYIVSAEQIDNITDAVSGEKVLNSLEMRKELLRTEKLIAGGIAVGQGFFHLLIPCVTCLCAAWIATGD